MYSVDESFLSFTYEALNDEEIEALSPKLEDGDHPFECTHASLATSKNGNPMLVLDLKVWNKEGIPFMLKDWILLTSNWIFKLKRFWESVGKVEKYNGKNTVLDFVGQNGFVKTKQEEDEQGVKRPRVKSYLPKDKIEVKVEEFNDDIPF